MEINTGAAAIIIREDTFEEIGQGKLEVKLASVKLKTYTGESIKVLRTVSNVVNYEQQKEELSALIVELNL